LRQHSRAQELPESPELLVSGFMKSHYATMSTRRSALVALIAFVFATSIARTAPTSEAPPQSLRRPTLSFDMNYLAVLSDFDGDHRVDRAELHLAGAHHCIRVRFGNTRETHLDFGTRPHSSGVLLVRDANRDNKPDLIWVYRTRSESAVIWLNDGAGHFAKSGDASLDVRLDPVFCDTDYAQTGSVEDKEIFLTPAQHLSEFAEVARLEGESLKGVMIPSHEFRRDLGVYLSYLRERGPPPAV